MFAKRHRLRLLTGMATLSLGVLVTTPAAHAQSPDINGLKAEAEAYVNAHAKLIQQIVDSTFSFQEIGYNENQTGIYLTGILQRHGFAIRRNIEGIPTAWVASWSNGSGRPTVSLNNDEDGLPGLSQMPGILKEQPMIAGGNGQSEGHNTGLAGMVVSALALQSVMEQHHISGTVQVWPGIAEEILGGKAWYVRAGVFEHVDAVLSTHVSSGLGTSYGRSGGTGMISAEYTFQGKTAHAAADPWDGKSALASAEMFDNGMNYMRQFFHPASRTQNVLVNGGDEPNVIPALTEDWYYFREVTPEMVRQNFATANRVAKAAAEMFGTTVAVKTIGTAWPSWGNQPLAEDMDRNIQAVGMPNWTADDQRYAKAVQALIGQKPIGLNTRIEKLGTGEVNPLGGPSDDIGDVMWTVPTVRLMFPANIPEVPFHNWKAALAEATPIAYGGAAVDAKVLAMTALDLYLNPQLVRNARHYFDDVQPVLAMQAYGTSKPVVYQSFLPANATPDISIHDALMTKLRPLMEKMYYRPDKYPTYLDQLGVKWPCLTQDSACGAPKALVPPNQIQ